MLANFNTIPPHVTLRLYQMVKDVHEVFTKYKIPYWIHGGTLLDAVRHKGIIPWDDDVDIVIEKQYEEKFLKTQSIFESLGYRFIKVSYGYNLFFPQELNHDVNLDIMLFVRKDNKYVYDNIGPTYQHIFFNENDLFPLKKYQFGQLSIMGPNDPIPYLNLAYPNWEIEAQMSNHFYFEDPTVPLLDEHLVPAQPTGPLVDNIRSLKEKFNLENIVIRDAMPSDTDALVDLLNQLGFPQKSVCMCIQKIEEFSKNDSNKIWVASLNNKIVGLLAINIITPFYKPKFFARIDSIIVDECYQKIGIGKILMCIAEEYAKMIGCLRIFLTSGNHRPSTHEFYSHLGYVSNATYFVKNL